MARFVRLVAVAGLFLLVASGAPAARAAATIQVYPGPDAITNALNAASPGDTLNIHGGTYPEAPQVSKANVTLKAAGDGRPVIDGECFSETTISVFANGVSLQGLKVIGGVFYEINMSFRSSGSIKNSVVHDTCDAEYGINLYQSEAIAIEFNVGSGFSDAGIYIGGIVSTGTGILKARRNTMVNNYRGIIVEDSAGGTIRITANTIKDNSTAGIFLTNSDGVLIRGNRSKSNNGAGITLTNGSDNNTVTDNKATGNGTDLVNEAGNTGNCFANNTYNTHTGQLPAC